MTAQRRISALLALLPLLPLIPPVAADCYWPDGSAAYDQHECYGADGADGLCCAEGDLCLLNRLCQARGPAPAALYRGACSLPGDTNSTCATMCTDARGGSDLAGEQPVGRCSGAGDTFYCDTGGDDDDEAVGLRNCSSFASDVQVYTLSGELSFFFLIFFFHSYCEDTAGAK